MIFAIVWLPFILLAAIPLIAVAPDIVIVEPGYIPWFGWFTVITPLFCVVVSGLAGNVLFGITSLTKVISECVDISKSALFKVNLRSLDCSGVQVDAFAELKKTPLYGCLVILSAVFVTSKAPISATKTL